MSCSIGVREGLLRDMNFKLRLEDRGREVKEN